MDPIESVVRLTLGSISYPGAGGLGFEPTSQLLGKILYSIGPIKPSLTFRTDKETNTSLKYFGLVNRLYHVKYRHALWGEHQQVLNSLRIVLSQLIIPLSNFLEPVESNSSMIRVYAAAILSGTVQITRRTLLFLIVVHHLNCYLYNKDD
ncbi:hypothetical protein Smp_158530 [Schistosoma mansoni]|uniref:hypothetical protein n=1 Tax=Schistosoma mansoni TaxID=6183 RepID=UPI0001A62970|nr:hypothetical protein Smp_158530 [Schistosoma mansoni]|eukprot:XP_018649210.1 hypothetical protein Smp_158530 [Schistosoma mansoni]